MAKLIRFWVEFEKPDEDVIKNIVRKGVGRGCGVTAFTKEDAINIMKETVFRNEDLPKILKLIENVDVNTLDQGHVIPNMGVVSIRGIWHPKGHSFL